MYLLFLCLFFICTLSFVDITLFKHPNGTEQQITPKIKNWLHLAKTRKHNRKGGKYIRLNLQSYLYYTCVIY